MLAFVAQRIEHLTTDQKVGGSSPSKRTRHEISERKEITGTMDYIKTFRRAWDRFGPAFGRRTSTSISDSGLYSGYLKSVRKATRDPKSLAIFRSNLDYLSVLGHTSVEYGYQYWEELQKTVTEPVAKLALLRELSVFGSPPVHNYPHIGMTSPSVLYYVKVAGDLNFLFGNLDDKRIGEIGIGFGGQAAVLEKLFGVTQYTAYDLPEVLELSRLFLENTNSSLTVALRDGRRPVPAELDLVISNYAFSELTRPLQNQYLHNVISASKSGYITWNDMGSSILDGYSLEDLLAMIPGSEIIPETPLTHKNNCIIVWGRTQAP